MLDETHTICAGPGGCTAAWGLEPDFLVIGKTIGGGMPSAAYGMTAAIAAALQDVHDDELIDTSGVGGTLTGNALAMAATRATLSTSLRDEDFALDDPTRRGVDGRRPWCVRSGGPRLERAATGGSGGVLVLPAAP